MMAFSSITAAFRSRDEKRAECERVVAAVATLVSGMFHRKLAIILLADLIALKLTAAEKSPFAGTWEGRTNDLPSVALMVHDDVGKVRDRKSTRLNSSHQIISYAVFCLKKKI